MRPRPGPRLLNTHAPTRTHAPAVVLPVLFTRPNTHQRPRPKQNFPFDSFGFPSNNSPAEGTRIDRKKSRPIPFRDQPPSAILFTRRVSCISVHRVRFEIHGASTEGAQHSLRRAADKTTGRLGIHHSKYELWYANAGAPIALRPLVCAKVSLR